MAATTRAAGAGRGPADVPAVGVEVVYAGETMAGVVVTAGRDVDGYRVFAEADDYGVVASVEHERHHDRRYRVRLSGGDPVSCSCPAARYYPGRPCRHRVLVARLLDLGAFPRAE